MGSYSSLTRVRGHVLCWARCLSHMSAPLLRQRFELDSRAEPSFSLTTLSSNEPFKMLLCFLCWLKCECVHGQVMLCLACFQSLWLQGFCLFTITRTLPKSVKNLNKCQEMCACLYPCSCPGSHFSPLTLYLSVSAPPLSCLQTTGHCVSGRTLPTRRTQRWWRHGRAFPTCCPLPEVSPPPALTVKINALFYYLPPIHPPIQYFL